MLFTGLPGFLREGFLPLGAFYIGQKLSGLGAGIAAASVGSALVYLYERRAGRDALLVRVSLAFVAVQSVVGLVSHSTTVYLAQPVLMNAAWGVAFLVSAWMRRPLAGVLACAWFPFPRSVRQSDLFKRVYGVESIVWGVYFVARSGSALCGAAPRKPRDLSRRRRRDRSAGDASARVLVDPVRDSQPERRAGENGARPVERVSAPGRS